MIGIVSGAMALYAGGQALKAGVDLYRCESSTTLALHALPVPESGTDWQQLLAEVDEADARVLASRGLAEG